MKECKEKIEKSFFITKKILIDFKNNILNKDSILNLNININKKKIFLKNISECIEEKKKIIIFIKEKNLLTSFYKKISLLNLYKIEKEKKKLIISLDGKKNGVEEKRKKKIELINNYKLKCNKLINKYKNKIPLSIIKKGTKEIKELRIFLNKKILDLKQISIF